MNHTYRATIGAFPKAMFPTLRNIFFVPEPEACGVFTVQDLDRSKENSLMPVRSPSIAGV